ncbi:hypothetical protein Thiosp_01961 [Thiorhodovibrio litoralis]|nr:hypothetical protein Thiosp_01961 [Thiorhodovibrio litoralis]
MSTVLGTRIAFLACSIALFLHGCGTTGSDQWFKAVGEKHSQQFLTESSDGKICSFLNSLWKPGNTDKLALDKFTAEAARRTGKNPFEIKALCSGVPDRDLLASTIESEKYRCKSLSFQRYPPLMETRYKDKREKGPCDRWSGDVDQNGQVNMRCVSYQYVTVKEPYQVDANKTARENSERACFKTSPEIRDLESTISAFRL